MNYIFNNNNIKVATNTNIDSLLPLFKYAYNFHRNNRKDIFIEKSDKDFKQTIKEFISEKNLNIFIYVIDNNIVGYIAFEIINNSFIYIDELAVKEDFQNKKIAKQLLDELYNYAKYININRVELGCWSFNKKAMNLYKSIGYKEKKVILEKIVK